VVKTSVSLLSVPRSGNGAERLPIGKTSDIIDIYSTFLKIFLFFKDKPCANSCSEPIDGLKNTFHSSKHLYLCVCVCSWDESSSISSGLSDGSDNLSSEDLNASSSLNSLPTTPVGSRRNSSVMVSFFSGAYLDNLHVNKQV